MASLVAAPWSHFRRHRFWVTACVAAPAVVVGGVSLMMSNSLLPHVIGAVALPAAFMGLVGGILGRDRGSA